MDGLPLHEEITRLQPGLRVMYLSGYTDDVLASRGVLREGIQLLAKPFSSDQLLARIRQVLDAP